MKKKYRKSLFYCLVSLTIAISIVVTNLQVSQAIPWGELIFRGIQFIQISNLSEKQEVEIGRRIREGLLSQGKIRLYQEPELAAYVEEIGWRLAKVSKRPNLPYSFEVVDDSQINAFATMGGFVYLNTGLIAAADNEAQLASVIAHEIGHIVARHSQKKLQQQAITQGLLTAAGLEQSKLVQLGVTLAVSLPYSRKDEMEADSLGLEMLQAAGYAPGAMVDFMNKLAQRSKNNFPSWLSTHPAAVERAKALQQKIPPILAYQGDGLDENYYRYRTRFLRAR